MSYGEQDIWAEARGDIIEQGIRKIRDDQISTYLGAYSGAVQKRIDGYLTEGKKLLTSGFPSQTVITAVTGVELILR